MAYTHYDRLSALDSSFLDLEQEDVHMHIGAVGVFEGGRRRPDGGLDLDRVRALAGPALRRSPRLRQRLGRVPGFGRRIWVDDPHFNLDYHLRHTSLPLPGNERTLKRLAGRIMSQKLDRSKPLWEMWLVEGLEEDRFAVISKIHHALIDGISGVDLLTGFMGAEAEARELGEAPRWVPRPAPAEAELFLDELGRRVRAPWRLASRLPKLLSSPSDTLQSVERVARGVADSLTAGTSSASPTSLNDGIGPHRRFDWLRFDLGVVREVKSKLGCTLNDVVLCVVAGAMRRFLAARGDPVDELEFRAFVPVSTRKAEQRGSLGNRVSMLLAPLPVQEADPARRAARVQETTQALKASNQVEGAEVVEELADWIGSPLVTGLSRLGASRRAYNVVVTNVPGPPMPVYMDGARMQASYPLVPLFTGQAVGIALFSYDGGLYWGLNADWDRVPDLHELVGALEQEFETLRKL